MSRVLVIRDANYAENRIGTVTFDDSVHATDIEFTSEFISIDGINATESINYTVTPADTTDAILWTTSDSSVATVADGIVTATGLGSCTITAEINSLTASCTVNVIEMLTGYIRAPKTQANANSENNHLTVMDCYTGTTNASYNDFMTMVGIDGTRQQLNCDRYLAVRDAETGNYYLPKNYTTGAAGRVYANIGYVVPIPLASGTTQIVCNALNEHYAAFPMFFKKDVRANETAGSQDYFSSYRARCETVAHHEFTFAQSATYEVPDGYDAVVVVWKSDSENGTVKFYDMTDEQIQSFNIVCQAVA